jgi:hypothetical protein
MRAFFSVVSTGFISFVLPFSMPLVMHQGGAATATSPEERERCSLFST